MQDGQGRTLPGLDVRINGPFNELYPDQMEGKLKSFLEWTELGTYEDLLRKAMFLAQDPQALDTDEKVQLLVHKLKPLIGRSVDLNPTELEQKHLARDKIDTTDESRSWKIDRKKWRLPWPLWRLVTLCALGALVQGWDESAVNSAQMFYQAAFKIWIRNKPQGLPPASTPPLAPQPWKVGLVNSAPYLCCVLSCWLTTSECRRWAARDHLCRLRLLYCICPGPSFLTEMGSALRFPVLDGLGNRSEISHDPHLFSRMCP